MLCFKNVRDSERIMYKSSCFIQYIEKFLSPFLWWLYRKGFNQLLNTEADDSLASTLRSSHWFHPPPPSTSMLGNSLPNSCVADGCLFFHPSAIFAMFTKSINDCTVSLGHSHYSSFKSNALATLAVFTVLGRASTIRFCHT